MTARRLRRGREVSAVELGAQLFADIAALSLLLALSGGAWNPLVPLLFFHAGLGALLLEGRVSLAFFWSLVACLAFVQAFGHVPPGLVDARVAPAVLFPAQFLVAGVFWLFTTWLSHTLEALQAQVHARREERGRVDRLRAVGALAAGLSHEFATPLNTAMLKLERLTRKLEPDAESSLAEAREALARCGDILRQMAGSQLRPDGLRLEVGDVADLVEQVCAGLRAEEPSVPLRFRREPGAALVVLPAIAFTQAVLNLVDNALEESSPEAPVEVDVRVTGGARRDRGARPRTRLARDRARAPRRAVRDHASRRRRARALLRLHARGDGRRPARARRRAAAAARSRGWCCRSRATRAAKALA